MPEMIDTVMVSQAGFSALAGLNNVTLLELLKQSQIFNMAKGEIRIAADEANRVCFLLAGEIQLKEHDKIMQDFSAGSDRAREPVFRVHTPGLVAVAQNEVKLLVFNRSLLDKHACFGSAVDEAEQIAEIEMSDDENDVLSEIYHAYHSHEVDLPSCPDVAIKINQAVQSEDLDIRKIANVIQADPVISARIVQLANSPVYFSSYAIGSVKDAITRIGLEATRMLVVSVVMKHLFTPQSELINHRMRTLYEHSIEVGAISHAIARHKHGFNPDHALLAGILHEIGVIPILIMADKHLLLATNPELLEKAIQKLHGYVGGLLLQQWGFEKELVTVAEQADDWMRDPGEKADYCDIVLLAKMHSRFIDGIPVDAPPLHEVPAFRKLKLGNVDPELGIMLLHEAKHDIAAMVRALKM